MMSTLGLIVFWFSLAIIAYTYIGYGALLAWLARRRARPVHSADIEPSVTVLVAAYNEAECIGAKIENTLALDYPADRLELLVVTDGSDDATSEIVGGYAARYANVRLAHRPERRGKAHALARAFPLANGEILLFSDANSLFAADILRHMVRHFADPEVGGVGGAKRMIGLEGVPGQGESLYWRYESFLKACDSALSSVMGVPGEVWAARRVAYRPVEADTILEDFVASLRLVEDGWRVVFEPRAIAYEAASPSLRAEWERRVRNSAGGWQAFFRLPGMLRHRNPWVTFQYLSHRMLRWMVTPSLFVLLLLSNLCLAGRSFYAATLLAQALFYLLAGLGWLLARRGQQIRWLLAPFYIIMLNAAALVGAWRFLRGRQGAVWQKVR
ncbi:MAG: glycosyltransferase family 2 protein [Chloroflexi bacterium]|nr:glycosyltransferase family 2 protein [Chloroflexota bacterium]